MRFEICNYEQGNSIVVDVHFTDRIFFLFVNLAWILTHVFKASLVEKQILKGISIELIN